jgi:hypothetical protein
LKLDPSPVFSPVRAPRTDSAPPPLVEGELFRATRAMREAVGQLRRRGPPEYVDLYASDVEYEDYVRSQLPDPGRFRPGRLKQHAPVLAEYLHSRQAGSGRLGKEAARILGMVTEGIRLEWVGG